eukprot:scaffold124602_cov42-Cyclotella_meneghiniana.AAC.1
MCKVSSLNPLSLCILGNNHTAYYVDHRPTTNDPLSLLDHIATRPRPQEMRNFEKLKAIILCKNG